MVASLLFLQNVRRSFSEVGVYVSALSHLLFFCGLLHFTNSINQSLIEGSFPLLTRPRHNSVNVCICCLKINHVNSTNVEKFSRQRSFSNLFYSAQLLLSENLCDSSVCPRILRPSILSATCISHHLIANVYSF